MKIDGGDTHLGAYICSQYCDPLWDIQEYVEPYLTSDLWTISEFPILQIRYNLFFNEVFWKWIISKSVANW